MSKNKEKTVLERHEIAKRIGEVMPPWDVYRLFSTQCKIVQVWGDQISLGEDFASLEECRTAVQWYVEQLGGKVQWLESK